MTQNIKQRGGESANIIMQRVKNTKTFWFCRGVGVGKQVGSMDEEPQVRGCYNITFICTPTNQETVSVLEKTQANKTFRIMKANVKSKQQQLLI